MKTTIIALLLTVACTNASAQRTFFYSIKAPAPADKKTSMLFIAYDMAGVPVTDTLDLNQKQPAMRRKLPQPVAASISTNNPDVAPIAVMLADNELSLTWNGNALAVAASPLQDDFLYLTENDRIRPTYFPLYDELSAKNDTVGLKKLGVVFEDLKKDDIKKSYDYFNTHKTALLSLFSFTRYANFSADYAKLETDFNALPDWARQSPDGKNIQAKILGAKSTQLNTVAKKFAQKSAAGQQVRLEDFNGKYVLLDFWASWCGPCRKQHPDLIRLYEKFKGSGFEIISVSLDADYDNWTKAIRKDKLPWTQISDLKGQQNEIALLYGVQSVPANFLIDPQGMIIGKDLDSEALYNLLKKSMEK
ncbi:TlpA disulfide reductase family protein [Flavobacterium sp.]|uniref:TlpA family protein disulfide reductase n=1 Tax=Flavobacterium sp. TaxID=239 RepID=UPI00260AF80B|nr:TlpA disulfide reductase family protein [Flavobacterium sp.]